MLIDKGLHNYWGYNTLGFFAPATRYYGPRALAGFRDMVRALHDGGIEVILDVVYNHTAEGNELGPTLSFKGIDNFSYYRTIPDNHRYYINDTGTGNTVNTSHPRVLQMVTDSLRYWVEEMHVDGFRFDLGTILGREPEGFDQRGGFFDAVTQDPVLSKVKLVGEPWDIGPGGYQVGGFPPGWAEWNDKYRDTVRDYWLDTDGTAPDFAARFFGSGDLYDLRGRRPWRASTSSPLTMASPSTTSSPTTRSTTRRMARTTRTATATTAAIITARKVRPRTRASMPSANARSATSWPRCCSPTARR